MIDPSESSRRLVRQRLRSDSITVLEAEDRESGVKLAERELPDLILLDAGVPGLDGFDTIRLLQQNARLQTIPVIFLSGVIEPEWKARGLDLGAVDFISQPCDPIEFLARVKSAMRSKFRQDVLEQRANIDALTGLFNRHALSERLFTEWNQCRGRGVPLAVLIADLDDFKSVNDRHGHSIGDAILRATAIALRDCVRGDDFVARYGGDEFLILAPHCDLARAVIIAERLRLAVAGISGTSTPEGIHLTLSLGASSTACDTHATWEPLLNQADAALMQAKAAGRNETWIYDHGIVRPCCPTFPFLPRIDSL